MITLCYLQDHTNAGILPDIPDRSFPISSLEVEIHLLIEL